MATRIAFCITELNDGGAERAFVRLVTGLERSEWLPAVITLQGGPLADELRAAGVPVTALGLSRTGQALRGLKLLTGALREFRPAILQTWLYHANLLGRIAAWRAGVPHVVAGIRVAEHRSRWRLRLDRWTARLVDRHVCVSEGVAQFMHLHGGLPRNALTVIPNGVDFARYADAKPVDLTSLGIPPLSPTVLFAGRMDPQKRPFLFLTAAERLVQALPNAHFLMVGDGPLRAEVDNWICSRNLGGRIHLLGWRNDLPSLFKSAACFVLTSRWEGMANVLLEAMAAGTPVVATDVEGVRELVTPGSTGLLVDPDSPTSLIDAIADVMRNPEAAAHRARAAQTYVQQNFTLDRVALSYANLYREIISPKAP